MKKYFLAGNLPYICLLIACAMAFFLGQKSVDQVGKYVVAERGAIVLQAVLDRSSEQPDAVVKEISPRILAVLQKYANLGYVVIDADKDENGNFAIAAAPHSTLDISQEIRDAVKAAAKD
jgi:hypothetical protein